VVNLDNCRHAVPYPQIGALSPTRVLLDTVSVVLSVEGSAFVPQSQILWNQNLLPTTFIDPRRLQTTVTKEAF
jgi:hypothetical protein